jgi:hypothetical protein
MEESISLQNLFISASSHLNLFVSKDVEQGFKHILGASLLLLDELCSVNEKQNSREKKDKPPRLSKRHVELAVNTAGTLSMFLLSTLLDKQNKARAELTSRKNAKNKRIAYQQGLLLLPD